MTRWHRLSAPQRSPSSTAARVTVYPDATQRRYNNWPDRRFTKMPTESTGAVPGAARTANQSRLHGAASRGPDRVPCPFDPSHDCKACEVDMHLRKCPSRKQARSRDQRAYIEPNCNLSTLAGGHDKDPDINLPPLNTTESRAAYAAEMGEEGLARLISKIRAIARKVGMDQPLRNSALCPESCKSQLDPVAEHEANIPMNPKHATQHASIIGNLEQLGLMEHPENTTFVDLGAGKGFMSLMIARATPARYLILNDNGAFRLKADRILRRMAKEDSKLVHFLRCRADLKDFTIGGALMELQDTADRTLSSRQGRLESAHVPENVVGLGKHLCGVATDWALKSLFSQSGFVLKGFCLAPCCHQRCQWHEYVGKEELLRLGLHQREVELMFWMGRWAFCGHEAIEMPEGTIQDHAAGVCLQRDGNVKFTPQSNGTLLLSRRDKVEAGLLSKVLLDYGRLAWIRSQSCSLGNHDLISYVDGSVSGENRLLAVSLNGAG